MIYMFLVDLLRELGGRNINIMLLDLYMFDSKKKLQVIIRTNNFKTTSLVLRT